MRLNKTNHGPWFLAKTMEQKHVHNSFEKHLVDFFLFLFLFLICAKFFETILPRNVHGINRVWDTRTDLCAGVAVM